ncbi:retinol dehydrogenase 13 [Folsomia candida]|uniref:Retinol dehydrogenase 13 n=1 Tax=Folsomia candida TaxID=158441 RepID=A0A226DDU5_FOLCA|nr:retinol dehydrogenase 13 [Folsomia candida]OXA42771.1 Retinol dehydrogenase 13 [Folsomia candida]
MGPWVPPRLMVITSAVGVVVGGSVLLKDFIVGHAQKLDGKIRADGKIVIVTGANTGIGKETVKEMAKRGATVYMACRDIARCQEARKEIVLESLNKKVYCRECDLADFNSIRHFVSEFTLVEDRCDILINNGGLMRSPRLSTKQGIEMQLGVNHMGHFLLTHLLLPSLQKAAPSRIVNVSSLAHTRGRINFEDLNSEKEYDPGAAYNQSKLANVLFTKELAKRLQGTGVTTNALHPGIVKTEIGRHMGLESSIMASIFVKPLLSFFLKSPEQGALTTLFVALDPSLEKVSGKYFSDCRETKVAPAGEDAAVARRLWVTSERWTGIQENASLEAAAPC